MKQLFDGVYLLQGQVGARPLYLPVFLGEYGALLLDTGCAGHVDQLVLPGFAELGISSSDLRFVITRTLIQITWVEITE